MRLLLDDDGKLDISFLSGFAANSPEISLLTDAKHPLNSFAVDVSTELALRYSSDLLRSSETMRVLFELCGPTCLGLRLRLARGF